MMTFIYVYWAYILGGFALLFFLAGVRLVPNNMCAVVEKRFSSSGAVRADCFIARDGEAGFQPNVLRGGLYWKMPMQYGVHHVPLVTIPQGQIGYVFARDGIPLEPTQTLGRIIEGGKNFQDVVAFLTYGGQRGPQRQILREGTYALNLAQFIVFTHEQTYYLPISAGEEDVVANVAATLHDRQAFHPIVIKGAEDMVGIVTVHEGPSLPQHEIIAPTVGDDAEKTEYYHNNFQDPEKFLQAGGRRGRQLQVLVEGTYYINRLFATVETISKVVVEVGSVGVIVSYVGDRGGDLSGAEYKHGETVEKGFKGVWSTPLMPGKYAFNVYAGKIIMVPTTNIILKWKKDEVGSHRFDENLSAIELITKDAFEPELPLSVVLHIDYRNAPLVIQRFGDFKKLVDQTLDPMVAAYFKNIGQTRTLIELIHERSHIQDVASREMKQKFAHYNLELEEVLIGTPMSSGHDRNIEVILGQLRERQIAIEQIETYARREAAAAKERELREAEAIAKQQTALTQSEISIQIQSNEGKAAYHRSLQEAARIKTLAEADAEREARVGIGKAMAVEEQVRAYGGPQFQVMQQAFEKLSSAIEKSKVDIVPRMLVNNGSADGKNGYNAFEGLMSLLMSERLGVNIAGAKEAPQSAAVQAMRESIVNGINGVDGSNGQAEVASGPRLDRPVGEQEDS